MMCSTLSFQAAVAVAGGCKPGGVKESSSHLQGGCGERALQHAHGHPGHTPLLYVWSA